MTAECDTDETLGKISIFQNSALDPWGRENSALEIPHLILDKFYTKVLAAVLCFKTAGSCLEALGAWSATCRGERGGFADGITSLPRANPQ